MATLSVAFSGSGFKFPVHIGALIAALESGHEIVEISGTSGGSIVASMWACDMPKHLMLDIAMNTDWRQYVKPQLTSILKGAINTGNSVHSFCEDITKGKEFHQLNRSLSIVSMNLTTNTPFIFNNHLTPTSKISDAIRGSVSIPLLFLPHDYKGMKLIDGVVTNSLPLDLLTDKDSKKVGVRIINTGKTIKEIPSRLNAYQVAKKALYHLIDTQDCWAVDSGHFGQVTNVYTDYVEGLNPCMSKSVRQRLIDDGYSSMQALLKNL